MGYSLFRYRIGKLVFISKKDVRKFYFTNPIGQIIIALDMLLLIIEFVFITYLRAKEL